MTQSIIIFCIIYHLYNRNVEGEKYATRCKFMTRAVEVLDMEVRTYSYSFSYAYFLFVTVVLALDLTVILVFDLTLVLDLTVCDKLVLYSSDLSLCRVFKYI